MRRLVADFARNQVKQQYQMDHAIPREYAVTRPSYPPFASVYQGVPLPLPPKKKPRPATSATRRALLSRRTVSTHSRHLAPIIRNTVWNSTISQTPSSPRTRDGRSRLRIVLYSRGNEGTRSLKLESHLMSAIGEQFEAYTAICCDFNKATMQQQISYAYHADIVSGMMSCWKHL